MHLKTTAREMQTFINFLPLLIGDLVPPSDEVWQFLCIFIDIIDTVLLPCFFSTSLIKLEHLITKHNSLFIKLFDESLKPKYHFLTHYVNAIKKPVL